MNGNVVLAHAESDNPRLALASAAQAKPNNVRRRGATACVMHDLLIRIKNGQTPAGRVSASSCVSHANACACDAPHICGCGCKPEQQAGRSGRPKMRQRACSSSCTQRTPAGLPFGMPGIGLVIDGAMQQAPQPGRHACSGTWDELLLTPETFTAMARE
jgi:hypothetical protein